MAEDGQKGVDMSMSEDPDLILMDLSLPVMDGWQATSTIKANNDTKEIPIIVLTAHAMAGDREKALDAGADEYDTKPIEFKRLFNAFQIQISKNNFKIRLALYQRKFVFIY